MPVVEVNGEEFEFPDDMPPDQIQGVMQKRFPQQQPAVPLGQAINEDFSSGDPIKIARTQQRIADQVLGMTKTGLETGKLTQAQKEKMLREAAGVDEIDPLTKFLGGASTGASTGLDTPSVLGLSAADLLLGAVGAGNTRLGKGVEDRLKAYKERHRLMSEQDRQMYGEGDIAGNLGAGVAQAATELPLNLIPGAGAKTAAQAVTRSALAGATIGGGSQYAQERGEGRGRGVAALQGAVSGAITGATTGRFGATGIESIFKKAGPTGVMAVVKEGLKDAGMEFGEEFTDQLQQDLVERITKNPDKPFWDSFKETMMAGGVGAILGGGIGTAKVAGETASAGIENRSLRKKEKSAFDAAESIADREVASRLSPDLKDTRGTLPIDVETFNKANAQPGVGPEETAAGPGEVESVALDPATGNPIPSSAQVTLNKAQQRLSDIAAQKEAPAKAEETVKVETGKDLDENFIEKPMGSHGPEVISTIPDAEWDKAMRKKKGEKWSMTADATAWAMTQESSPELISRLDELAAADTKKAIANGEFPQKAQWYNDAAHVLRGDDVGLGNIKTVQGMADQGRIKIVPNKIKSSLEKAALNHNSSDSVSGDFKFISDFSKAESFIKHGLGGFDIPTQRIVKDSVFRLAENPKVLKAIIELVPVDVMNRFRGKKLSADLLLNDPSVLSSLNSIKTEHDIPLRGKSDISKAIFIVADVAAKTLSPSHNVKLSSTEGVSATQAGGSNKHEDNLHSGKEKSTRVFGDVATSGGKLRTGTPSAPSLEVPAAPASAKAAKKEFTNLVIENGERMGWIGDLQRYVAGLGSEGEGYAPANVALDNYVKRVHDAVFSAVGMAGEEKTPANFTEALQRLKKLIEEEHNAERNPPKDAEYDGGNSDSESNMDDVWNPTGLGGAAVGEVAPSGTALKNAVGELERASHGLPEIHPTKRIAMQESLAEAEARLAKDADAGQKLADELKWNPERGMTDVDSALLLRHKVDLINRKNQAAEDTFKAETPEAKAEAQARFDDLSNQLLDLLDAARFRGSQWGREGRWRQALMMDDFSLESMRRDAQRSKDGPLTPQESEQIQKLHDRIAELEKEVAKKRAAEGQKETQTDLEGAVDETVKRVKKAAAQDKAAGKVRDLEAEQKSVLDNLKETFIENGDITGSESSIRKLMELLVEREGITDRLKMEDRVMQILHENVDPTLTREHVLDLMSSYGKSRVPSQVHAKKVVRDINAQILSVRKLLDYFKGQVPKLTGQLRDAPSDIQRAWLKMVNEAKKSFKLDVPTDPAKSVKSALDAITTRLNNRIKDVKQELATRQKIIRERQPTPYNEETIKLRKELDDLLKQREEMFGGKTDAEKLAIAEKSADRQIAELERQIKSGEIFPKSKQVFGLKSEKLDAAKAKIEELKLQRQFARESAQPKLEPHEQFLLNYLLRLRQRESAYRERAASGNFEKAPKVAKEITPDIAKALANVDKAKQEFYKKRHEWEMVNRTTGRKIWDGIQKARGAFVNIASSFDFSAPRQGLLAILGNLSRLITHPTQGAKLIGRPMVDMFKAWASESKAREIEQRIKNRPNAVNGVDKRAKVEYSDLETNKFTKYEENAHSILDEWAAMPLGTNNPLKTAATLLPKLGARGVRMSNRAFTTFLNQTRAGLLDELLRVNYKDRPPTTQELELIGNMVNIATGRGKMNPITSRVASEVIWAPKLLASRVQALTGQPLWTGKWKDSARARMVVAKEYARIIMGGFLLAAVARMFDEKDEKEPTSSDFGKVVRGNTRIDPWGGLQQVTTLGARLGTATTTTLKGDTRDIGAARKYGQRNPWYVLADFGRSKLRPEVAAIIDIMNRTDYAGNPTTPTSVAQSLLVPLPMREITSVMQENGFTEGMIIEALGQFGAGVSVYEQKEGQK